jgi:GH35 family endo-1,4-beta-xylanase
MQIVNKREDWSFFNNNLEGLADTAKEARDLFVQALQNLANPQLASKLADESLQKAMVLSEKLAIKHSNLLFDVRGANRGFSRACLGCKVNPGLINNSTYIEKLLELFSFVTVPINWAQIESQRGNYDFSTLDVCVEILSKKRLAIGGGPLLCFSKEYLPQWLLKTGWGFEKIRDTAYKFVSKVVGRYCGNIRMWRVISGLNTFNHFGFNFEQVLELTRAANMATKAASDRTLKIIEITNPWGEYYATSANSIPPLVYLDMIVQSGINFDAFGLQMRFGRNQSGMHVRDMMQISAVLDYFALLAKPLYITDVEVPGESGEGPRDGRVAGIWHKPWDQTQQSQWIEQFYKIAISKPFVDTVTYSHLADVENSFAVSSGLLTPDCKPKKAFEALLKLKEDIFSR